MEWMNPLWGKERLMKTKEVYLKKKKKEVYLFYQMKVFVKTEGSRNLNSRRDVRKGYINSNPDKILYSYVMIFYWTLILLNESWNGVKE